VTRDHEVRISDPQKNHVAETQQTMDRHKNDFEQVKKARQASPPPRKKRFNRSYGRVFDVSVLGFGGGFVAKALNTCISARIATFAFSRTSTPATASRRSI